MSRDVVKKRGFLTTEKLKENCAMSLKSVIEEGAEVYGDNYLISDYLGVRYTYKDFNEKTNRLANLFQEEFGAKKQDVDIVDVEGNFVVAILMDNCADYIITEMGISKSGAIFALINNNINGIMLSNVLAESYPSLMVCDVKYKKNLEDIGLQNDLLKIRNRVVPVIWYDDGEWEFKGIPFRLDDYSGDNLPERYMSRDVAGLLYTSGTTGGAKAAVLTFTTYARPPAMAYNQSDPPILSSTYFNLTPPSIFQL